MKLMMCVLLYIVTNCFSLVNVHLVRVEVANIEVESGITCVSRKTNLCVGDGCITACCVASSSTRVVVGTEVKFDLIVS